MSAPVGSRRELVANCVVLCCVADATQLSSRVASASAVCIGHYALNELLAAAAAAGSARPTAYIKSAATTKSRARAEVGCLRPYNAMPGVFVFLCRIVIVAPTIGLATRRLSY